MVEAAASEALKLEKLAEQMPDERAQLLIEAAREWSLAGDASRAERLYEMAISDGGPVEKGDARTHYARFLFGEGAADRASEVLRALWTTHPTDPRVYESAGKLLEDQYDLAGAIRWLTAGAVRCSGGTIVDGRQLADPHLAPLLEARARVRKFTDQPPDAWDRIWFDHYERTNPGKKADKLWTREHLAELKQETALLRDENAILRLMVRGPVPMVQPYWPRSEFDRAVAAFPEAFADLTGEAEPHVVHRRTIEAALRAAETGSEVTVVPLAVDSVHAYAQRTGLEPDSTKTHLRCATMASMAGDGVAWPPGRNDPCWCGSARKYKKCCGTPDFAAAVNSR